MSFISNNHRSQAQPQTQAFGYHRQGPQSRSPSERRPYNINERLRGQTVNSMSYSSSHVPNILKSPSVHSNASTQPTKASDFQAVALPSSPTWKKEEQETKNERRRSPYCRSDQQEERNEPLGKTKAIHKGPEGKILRLSKKFDLQEFVRRQQMDRMFYQNKDSKVNNRLIPILPKFFLTNQ